LRAKKYEKKKRIPFRNTYQLWKKKKNSSLKPTISSGSTKNEKGRRKTGKKVRGKSNNV